ncbi:DUF309 domain-containing protein [Macrococcus animalis]|uniref:DUF309 domain-containing protein n=1 Tax=Macrococcus animalis TaxID=3395467 RepID=UPI0039BEA64D
MNSIFRKAFQEFIIEFHEKRDYFECHEIMEEAWKAKPTMTKQDPEVALIMFATALYHLRRNNIQGASTLFNKTIHLLTINAQTLNTYLDVDQLIATIKVLQQNLSYQQIMLPLKTIHHCDEVIFPTDDIVHKHKRRDRTDIIRLRQQALNNKNPIQYSPNQTHDADKSK